MNRTSYRTWGLGLLSLLGTILLWIGTAAPGQAHWADLAAAELVVNETDVHLTLTFPTGLTPFADRDRNGQLSPAEVRSQAIALQDYMQQHIQLTDSTNQPATLTVKPLERALSSPTAQAAPNTHSSLLLVYSWSQPLQGVKIHYNLFLPGVSTASCLATILHNHQLKTFVFTPTRQMLTIGPELPGFAAQGGWLAIVGALIWGAVHSLSPGHGKTIVAAYLVGTRATAQHALFLALTTTVTHTIGVMALGLVTLFAAHLILPEQLYPWISLISGLLIVAIGINLLRNRLNGHRSTHEHSHSHSHSDLHDDHQAVHFHSHVHHCSVIEHPHSHRNANRQQSDANSHVHAEDAHGDVDGNEHQHSHEHQLVNQLTVSQLGHARGRSIAPEESHQLLNPHSHAHHSHSHPHVHLPIEHSHSHPHTHQPHHSHSHSHSELEPAHFHSHVHHSHSHLPPGADGAPVTWRSLLTLGISGGLVPCPAALVLLLGCIALGNIGLGLLLVLTFSLGLAGVLTGLGLVLVYAKRSFHRLPTSLRPVKALPAISALCVTIVGCVMSTQALLQVIQLR